MTLLDEVTQEVARIFRERWSTKEGTTVPQDESLTLSNDASTLDATVLYTDLSASTKLVDSFQPHFAAEVYKAFLYCAAKVIRSEGGEITAYDGDRIMAVFVGSSKNTSAARTALKINWARLNIINPAIKNQYEGRASYTLQHVTGVDTSQLFVAKTGIRGANDLVWVGRAANHAAKLATLPPDFPSYIASEVYERLDQPAKVTNGQAMWEARTWTGVGRTIYASTWQWGL